MRMDFNTKHQNCARTLKASRSQRLSICIHNLRNDTCTSASPCKLHQKSNEMKDFIVYASQLELGRRQKEKATAHAATKTNHTLSTTLSSISAKQQIKNTPCCRCCVQLRYVTHYFHVCITKRNETTQPHKQHTLWGAVASIILSDTKQPTKYVHQNHNSYKTQETPNAQKHTNTHNYVDHTTECQLITIWNST